MGLETTNVITGLNEANPTTADAIQQGDDHIRLIKAVLKHCFPNVNAPLTASMIPNVPAGGIAATTLQAAIDELDSEKANKDGTGATGTWGISISGNAATATSAISAVNATNATNASNAAGVADGAVSTTAKLANSIVTNAKLARAGTTGQLLTSQGTGADPIWANPPSGGVGSFNSRTGAVTLTSGDVTAALAYTPATRNCYSGAYMTNDMYGYYLHLQREGGGETVVTTGVPMSGGICLHPHSVLETLQGPKFLCDVRPGDLVKTEAGFTAVKGVWESTLGHRPMVSINGQVACTPGHLFPLLEGGWAAVDVDEHRVFDANLTCPVKTRTGLENIQTKNPGNVIPLVVGMQLRNGESVRSVEFFNLQQPYMAVYSVVLEVGEHFYADGLLVATLD